MAMCVFMMKKYKNLHIFYFVAFSLCFFEPIRIWSGVTQLIPFGGWRCSEGKGGVWKTLKSNRIGLSPSCTKFKIVVLDYYKCIFFHKIARLILFSNILRVHGLRIELSPSNNWPVELYKQSPTQIFTFFVVFPERRCVIFNIALATFSFLFRALMRQHLLTAPGVLRAWSSIHKSKPGPTLLDFGDQMGTGMTNEARGHSFSPTPCLLYGILGSFPPFTITGLYCTLEQERTRNNTRSHNERNSYYGALQFAAIWDSTENRLYSFLLVPCYI